IGDVKVEEDYKVLDIAKAEDSIVRCPVESKSDAMTDAIKAARKDGDSLGGNIFCVIRNTPVGLGEPVFDRLNADLAKAMFSIQTVKGFELGSGFGAITMKGSEHNDIFVKEGDRIVTETNNSGGIQGGISNGMDIYFNVAFKPVSTIMKDQKSVDKAGNEVLLKGKGRHDVCVVPRAVPIVEAMAALVIADHLLRDKTTRITDI
ncbi:MAG: chorismate synthase, partial [Bacteroidetes bacterium]|nr:chorismate synthase [Bacteroidota bacterium]